MRQALALLFLASPALAEPPLDADAFDALTRGRTMTWAVLGEVYGIEQYLPGRRVRWTEVGGDCVTGHWYPEASQICFRYDGDPEPACWTVTAGAAGLIADPGAGPTVVVTETAAPLACHGPEVGV